MHIGHWDFYEHLAPVLRLADINYGSVKDVILQFL